MKHLKQIFQALLGVVALIFTAIIAFGRLVWRTIRTWWSRRAKWVRCVLGTLMVTFASAFAIIIICSYIDNAWGRWYWNDKDLSERVEVRGFRDDTFRVYNSEKERYTTPRLSWVSTAAPEDSLAVYALPGRRGYINVNTGRIVIDAKANDYRKAWVFSEGLAAVMKDDKIGFINPQNEVVIPFQFDYSEMCSSWDMGYVFHNGYCIMTNKEGYIGLIDKSGNWVVEPAYDEIWTPHTSGCRVIVKDGKHGVLNADCTVAYPAEYGYVRVLPDGFVLTKGGKQWQVDFEGNIVQPFMFDNTYYLNYPIGYNECGEIEYAFADFVKYEVMNCYGIMNRITGEPITPAIYSDINMLSEELFEVQEYDSYEWYLLDAKGNVVSDR